MRQGNQNKSVKIFRYVTEGTFDSYSWQLIETKQRFIGQIMTSKSPVRSCEDVDEAALSYAEIKALATGNPYIKEKMDLDIQVSKLKLLKANHNSQRYQMEDDITRNYPQQITELKEIISGIQADIKRMNQNIPKNQEEFYMKIGDKTYTEKKIAAETLLTRCKEIKAADGPILIGEYLGFQVSISFEPFFHQFKMKLKGDLTYPLKLGTAALGNISRMNHVLNSLPQKLKETQESLENVERQLEVAKVEVLKPFEQEQELVEKMGRLSELDAILNVGQEEQKESAETEETVENQSIQKKLEGLKKKIVMDSKAPISFGRNAKLVV